ncbi:MAG TPA: hypothetical protein VF876_14160 [Burkholderiales bacterium]
MSPRWRDEIHLLLTPGRVALRRYARGLRPALAQDQWREVPGAPLRWEPALEALEALLAAAPARGADATVVLSSHFVRYCLVPQSELLATREDEARFARHNFIRIHGAAAEGWSVRVSAADGVAGGSGVASAIEQELVDALRELARRHGLRARALQPALMAAFNRARASLPAGGCRLLVLEPGLAVSALLEPGWRRVRSQRLSAPLAQALGALLERERALEGEGPAGAVTCVLPLLDPGEPLAEIPGVELRALDALWPDASAAQAATASRNAA